MNKTNLKYIFDINGEVYKRTCIESIRIKVFAGIKFILDRLFAIIGIIAFSPIMLIIAILIKIDSNGPILFVQDRTGKNGKIFKMYKFRTMVESNDVHDFKKNDEPTRFGKILRQTSLDELPQLFTIASGKMSFIGPRPWITDYYDNMNKNQRHRNDVRPGLTGLAQCMGRNNISIFDKINYDLEYIKKYSFSQDIKIIFLTIQCVLKRSGVNAGKNTIKNELNELKNKKVEDGEI